MADNELVIKFRIDRSQAKAATDAQIKGSKDVVAAAQDAARAIKRTMSDTLTDAEVMERARTQVAVRGNQERIKAAVAEMNAARAAGAAQVQTFTASAEASGGLVAGLKAIGAAAGGLQIVSAAGQAMADVMKEARTHADELAKRFIVQRDALREIAAISGRKADKSLVADVAAFDAKTGMKPEESKGFIGAFLNSGAQSIGEGKSLTEAQAAVYRDKVGALAVVKGIDPEVAGNLAGAELGAENFGAKGQGPAEAAHRINRALETLGRGQGSNAVNARQLQMVAASQVNEDPNLGMFRTLDEAAVAVSVAAEKSPAGAAEMVQATGRGLYSVVPKEKAVLDQAGIGKDTPFFDRVAKMGALLDKKAAEGVKPGDFLAETFGDQLTREGIMTFYNRGLKGGVIEDRRKFLETQNDPNRVDQVIDEFQNDPNGAGPDRLAEARKRQVESARGAEKAPLATLRTQAAANVEAAKYDEEPLYAFGASVAGSLKGVLGTFGLGGLVPDLKETLTRNEMKRIVDERAEKQGGTAGGGSLGNLFPALFGYGNNVTAGGEDRAMLGTMRSIEAAGGNPLRDLEANTSQTNALLRTIADRLPPQPTTGTPPARLPNPGPRQPISR